MRFKFFISGSKTVEIDASSVESARMKIIKGDEYQSIEVDYVDDGKVIPTPPERGTHEGGNYKTQEKMEIREDAWELE